ncbi:hypothetical protein BDV97DRAFT_372840 [Delphinella strobiligena]|nr:hypothetical protein BDV97DRAFT_372840 [Delphinella strobiligena]
MQDAKQCTQHALFWAVANNDYAMQLEAFWRISLIWGRNEVRSIATTMEHLLGRTRDVTGHLSLFYHLATIFLDSGFGDMHDLHRLSPRMPLSQRSTVDRSDFFTRCEKGLAKAYGAQLILQVTREFEVPVHVNGINYPAESQRTCLPASTLKSPLYPEFYTNVFGAHLEHAVRALSQPLVLSTGIRQQQSQSEDAFQAKMDTVALES